MGILVVALGNFLIGSFIGPVNIDEYAKGFVGYNCKKSTNIANSNFIIH